MRYGVTLSAYFVQHSMLKRVWASCRKPRKAPFSFYQSTKAVPLGIKTKTMTSTEILARRLFVLASNGPVILTVLLLLLLLGL